MLLFLFMEIFERKRDRHGFEVRYIFELQNQ